jgi:AcrR family transcriptional regulator
LSVPVRSRRRSCATRSADLLAQPFDLVLLGMRGHQAASSSAGAGWITGSIASRGELFAERGYHATTLPDIAEAADVSTRTIFACFPSKEDILFSDYSLMKDALAQALAERPEGEDAQETVRKFILSLHEVAKSDLDEELRLCVEHSAATEAPASDPRPQVVAASLTAAFNVLAERGGASSAKPKSAAEIAAVIDPVITFPRGGLDALKETRTTRRR